MARPEFVPSQVDVLQHLYDLLRSDALYPGRLGVDKLRLIGFHEAPHVRVQTISWIWFINKDRIHDIDPIQCGKWMFFFSPFKTALMDDIVGTAILDGVVVEAKYSNPETLIAAGSKQGVCCFYLNGIDREGHKRVLSYMLNNGLIRKIKSGRLYNISFKYDTQTYAGKYKGSGFSGAIKLADFVDLETGEFV